jgi:hypothetical protein
LRFGKPVGEGEKVCSIRDCTGRFRIRLTRWSKFRSRKFRKVNSTVGWYFTTPEQELSGEELPAGASLNPAVDGYAITADRNIIHTRATLYYHIEDPIHFVFNFVSASNTVQNALNNALLYTAAHFNVDDILTRDVAGFRDAVLQRVSDLTEQEQLGIVIDNARFRAFRRGNCRTFSPASPPRGKIATSILNDARSYENQVLSQAGAQASAITNAAAADRARYVQSITAEAKRFHQ